MRSDTSTVGTEQELTRGIEELERELSDAHRREAATAQILKAINRSTFNLQEVLDTLIETAVQLIGAEEGLIIRQDGEVYRAAAIYGASPEFVEVAKHNPIPQGRQSATGRAVLERRIIHIHDVFDDPEYTWVGREAAGVRTILAVPMLREEIVVGVIGCGRREVRPFTAKQIELVQAFADQAVIAIENTRLLNELRESLQQQTATADVLKVISRATFDLPRVLDTLVESAATLCDSYDTSILQKDGDVLRIVAHHGPIPHTPFGQPRPLTRGAAIGRAVLDRQTIHLADVQSETDEYPESSAFAQRQGFHTMLAVPLIGAGEAVGAITLRRSEVRPFTDRQIELLQTFADQAVIAIENTRLFEAEQASKRELHESLEYQTATSEVLSVISRSKFELQPVLDTLVESAVRLCQAERGFIWRLKGNVLQFAAGNKMSPEVAKFALEHPPALDRSTGAGRSVLEKRTIHIPDLRDDPEYSWHGGQGERIGQYRTVLGVPLLRDGEAFGAFALLRGTPRPFSDKQIELVTIFADQAVIAIENARLLEEVQTRSQELARSVRELKSLSAVAQAVSSSLELTVVLARILEHACTMSGAGSGAIYAYDKARGQFNLQAGHNMSEELSGAVHKHPIRRGESVVGQCVERRQAVQIDDLIAAPPHPLYELHIRAGVRALLAVPLLRQEEVVGALVVRRQLPGTFTHETVALLQAFADQSAIALENARLFEEIAQKSRELEIASRHKSLFVANMSHELRTPLAAILGYAELMQEGFYESLGQKSMDALTRIRSNGKHLLGLINTVLDIAKIESGQFSLNLGEYALESVVETVRAATESLAETKKLALKTDVAKKLPVGLGDEQRLTQVLLNLVGNAIKFTDAGEVRVTAKAVNGHFNVSVADTGPGIPEHERTRIFEQFHQIDSSLTKAAGGTGLGLAIAKQIVEMHGGRIWVESTVGKGSTFQMEIPTRAEFRMRTL